MTSLDLAYFSSLIAHRRITSLELSTHNSFCRLGSDATKLLLLLHMCHGWHASNPANMLSLLPSALPGGDLRLANSALLCLPFFRKPSRCPPSVGSSPPVGPHGSAPRTSLAIFFNSPSRSGVVTCLCVFSHRP